MTSLGSSSSLLSSRKRNALRNAAITPVCEPSASIQLSTANETYEYQNGVHLLQPVSFTFTIDDPSRFIIIFPGSLERFDVTYESTSSGFARINFQGHLTFRVVRVGHAVGPMSFG